MAWLAERARRSPTALVPVMARTTNQLDDYLAALDLSLSLAQYARLTKVSARPGAPGYEIAPPPHSDNSKKPASQLVAARPVNRCPDSPGHPGPGAELARRAVRRRDPDRRRTLVHRPQPRLVEPVNAYRSGVDLTGALVKVARSGPAAPQPDGHPGERTHQGLLAILGAARGGRRRDIAREVAQPLTRTGPYRHSTEELTPARGDLIGAAPYVLATLAHPLAWSRFVTSAASAHSLTPAAWQQLLASECSPLSARPPGTSR